MELYRSQRLGRLRSHPGQRKYETVPVSPRLATFGHLDSDHCAICHRSIDGNDTLIAGHIDTVDQQQLYVCAPLCPRYQGALSS